jgi:serine protease
LKKINIKSIIQIWGFILLFHLNLYGENLLVQFQPLFINENSNELRNLISIPSDYQFEKWIPFSTENDFINESYIHLIYRISSPKFTSSKIQNLLIQLQQNSKIRKVEIENNHKIHYTPNDPEYLNQWYLGQINYPEALNQWNIPDGISPQTEDILFVPIDTGVDWTHTDLISNIWQNLDEDADNDGRTIECNGSMSDNICNGNWILDPDDLNGIDDDDWDLNPDTFIDDLIGWDFAGDSGIADNNPKPMLNEPFYSGWNHGTHVAGLLTASTNNEIGVASSGFNGNLMAIKCSKENDGNNLTINNGFSAILYSAKKGYYTNLTTIINTSWGSELYSDLENDVILVATESYDAIIVASAGNGQNSFQINAPTYPASYESVISVAPLGVNDTWNNWANYHHTIDISAPGENIISTIINNQYGNFTGSSQSSPIVASSIGLLATLHPEYQPEQLIRMIIETANPNIYQINPQEYLQGNLGYGRINLESALITPLFPELSISLNTINIINDFDGIASAGDTIEITISLQNSIFGGDADSINISPFVNHPEITVESNDIQIPQLNSGETISLTNNIIIINYSTDMTSGIYNLYFNVSANQHLQGIPFETMLSIPLFIYDFIYYGDVNQDQKVDIMDAIITQEIIFDNLTAETYSWSNANLNFDDSLNIIDVILIINKILMD